METRSAFTRTGFGTLKVKVQGVNYFNFERTLHFAFFPVEALQYDKQNLEMVFNTLGTPYKEQETDEGLPFWTWVEEMKKKDIGNLRLLAKNRLNHLHKLFADMIGEDDEDEQLREKYGEWYTREVEPDEDQDFDPDNQILIDLTDEYGLLPEDILYDSYLDVLYS